MVRTFIITKFLGKSSGSKEIIVKFSPKTFRLFPVLLWQTADANAFLDLFCLLRRAPAMCAGLSALYRTEGGFAGLFSFADAKAAKKGARLLAEYGDVRAAGREMRRHLDEHARALMPPKAPTPALPRPRAL